MEIVNFGKAEKLTNRLLNTNIIQQEFMAHMKFDSLVVSQILVEFATFRQQVQTEVLMELTNAYGLLLSSSTITEIADNQMSTINLFKNVIFEKYKIYRMKFTCLNKNVAKSVVMKYGHLDRAVLKDGPHRILKNTCLRFALVGTPVETPNKTNEDSPKEVKSKKKSKDRDEQAEIPRTITNQDPQILDQSTT